MSRYTQNKEKKKGGKLTNLKISDSRSLEALPIILPINILINIFKYIFNQSKDAQNNEAKDKNSNLYRI